MVRMKSPDWKCVFTYVQMFYRRFALQPKQNSTAKVEMNNTSDSAGDNIGDNIGDQWWATSTYTLAAIVYLPSAPAAAAATLTLSHCHKHTIRAPYDYERLPTTTILATTVLLRLVKSSSEARTGDVPKEPVPSP